MRTEKPQSTIITSELNAQGGQLDSQAWISLHKDPRYVAQLKTKPTKELSVAEKAILDGECPEVAFLIGKEASGKALTPNEIKTLRILRKPQSNLGTKMKELLYPHINL